MTTKALAALQIILVTVLAAPIGAAPPVPQGTEIRVNTDTQVSHFNPSVAVFPGGSFVVVWTTASGARARFFDRQGSPTSDERRLPVGGFVNQVVADRDGSFLVVSTTSTASDPSSDVYVRRFKRDGTPRGKAIRANETSPSDRDDAVAAIGPDGRLSVAWRARVDVSEENGYTNAVARIFSAQGTPVTPEITLREGDAASPAGDDALDAYPTSLALTPDGTLAALVQDDETGACIRSYLVRVPPGGSPSLQGLGNIGCSPPYLGSSLAMGKDGSLVATWSDFSVQAQRFAPDGTPRGQSFGVSTGTEGQSDASVALQAGGSFVIAWTERSGRDGDGSGIFGRAFAPNGIPRTQDFQINVTTTGDQFDPAIAAARQGPIIVVWSQQLTFDGPSDIFARVLSAKP
jgi:large repetitive protein